ncbi:hypothetical protein [Siminovitchia terrae]|uniref:hypothetical protein n=1 Tax=Siminovitchia terrae TaxID=1914933 RepID=UPI00163D0D5A|nr:hypothetical protein [Siminovitchia terrae]
MKVIPFKGSIVEIYNYKMNRTFLLFNFIQQKSPTSVNGEMNAYWYSIQWGFKPRLNKS